MTEKDYINVSDLVSLRAALDLITCVMGGDQERMLEIRKTLSNRINELGEIIET